MTEKTLKWKLAQRVELKWWSNYLKDQDRDEYLNWKREYWENLSENFKHTLLLPKGAKLLDAGCGPAGIFKILNDYHVDAVDPLMNAYHEHLKHFKKENYPHTRFFSQALEDFVSEEKYDAVFCMNAINHVSNIDKSIAVLCNVVKSQGHVVLSIDAHNFSIYKHLFRLVPGDILHPHQYTLNEYVQKIEGNNFKIIDCITLKMEYFFTHYMLIAQKI